jgi:hypothetical protein
LNAFSAHVVGFSLARTAFVADVTKSADLNNLFQQVREKYGRIT